MTAEQLRDMATKCEVMATEHRQLARDLRTKARQMESQEERLAEFSKFQEVRRLMGHALGDRS